MANSIATIDLSVGGSVVSDSSNVQYFIGVNGSGNLVVYSDLAGTPTLEDSDTPTTIFGGGNIAWVKAAMRSDDDIEIACACDADQTRDIAFATFDTATGTIGSWAEAAPYTDVAPTNPGLKLVVDNSDISYILYVDGIRYHGTDYDQISFVENSSGWSTPVTVSQTQDNNYSSPVATVYNEASIIVSAHWINLTTGDIWGASYTSSGWGSYGSTTPTSGATLGNKFRPSSSNIYVVWADGSDIKFNSTDTGYNTHATNNIPFGAAIGGTERYIFYIDTSDDVHIAMYGGSPDPGVVQTGTYVRVIPQYSWRNNNHNNRLHYVFEDNAGTVYYDYYDLGGRATKNTDSHPLGIGTAMGWRVGNP